MDIEVIQNSLYSLHVKYPKTKIFVYIFNVNNYDRVIHQNGYSNLCIYLMSSLLSFKRTILLGWTKKKCEYACIIITTKRYLKENKCLFEVGIAILFFTRLRKWACFFIRWILLYWHDYCQNRFFFYFWLTINSH